MDETRWNLRLKQTLYGRLQELHEGSGVAAADVARLAIVRLLNELEGGLTLEWVEQELAALRKSQALKFPQTEYGPEIRGMY